MSSHFPILEESNFKPDDLNAKQQEILADIVYLKATLAKAKTNNVEGIITVIRRKSLLFYLLRQK